MAEKSLREELDDMKAVIEYLTIGKNAPQQTFMDKLKGTKKLEKEFKLPKKFRLDSKRKLKENYAIIFYIRDNGSLDIYNAPIVDEGVYIKESGMYHTATANYVLRYKKYPALIIPEWNLNPIGKPEEQKPHPFDPSTDIAEAEEKGMLSLPQKVLINRLALAEAGLLKKGKMGGKMILWVILGGIAVIYGLSKLLGK